jgi:hypothetical protein
MVSLSRVKSMLARPVPAICESSSGKQQLANATADGRLESLIDG